VNNLQTAEGNRKYSVIGFANIPTTAVHQVFRNILASCETLLEAE